MEAINLKRLSLALYAMAFLLLRLGIPCIEQRKGQAKALKARLA
jgi:hypothetical protein